VGDGNAEHVRGMFGRAAFIAGLGISLDGSGDGWCEASLAPRPEHGQQHDHVHAAVVYALADHTAGGAAGTKLGPGEDVITVENKISYLRPARGERLRCRAVVLRAGRTLVFTEAEVFADDRLVAKLMSTLAVIPNRISG
jgi:uncharacterized protein (TIGR00369 family)